MELTRDLNRRLNQARIVSLDQMVSKRQLLSLSPSVCVTLASIEMNMLSIRNAFTHLSPCMHTFQNATHNIYTIISKA